MAVTVLKFPWDEIDVEATACVGEGFCPRCKQRLQDMTRGKVMFTGRVDLVRTVAACLCCYYFYVISDGSFEVSFEQIARTGGGHMSGGPLALVPVVGE